MGSKLRALMRNASMLHLRPFGDLHRGSTFFNEVHHAKCAIPNRSNSIMKLDLFQDITATKCSQREYAWQRDGRKLKLQSWKALHPSCVEKEYGSRNRSLLLDFVRPHDTTCLGQKSYEFLRPVLSLHYSGTIRGTIFSTSNSTSNNSTKTSSKKGLAMAWKWIRIVSNLWWLTWWILVQYCKVSHISYLGLKGDPNFLDLVFFIFGVEILLYKFILVTGAPILN